MALTRKFLKALGLSDQSVQAILQAHTQALEALRASLPQTRAAGGSRGDGTAAPAAENDARPLSTRAENGTPAARAGAAEADWLERAEQPPAGPALAPGQSPQPRAGAENDARPLSDRAQDGAPAPDGDDEGPEALWRQKYEALQREFEVYRAGVAAQRAQAARELAARAWYQSQGITGAALRIALRGSAAEIAALRLDDNGQLLDDAPLKALLAGDFAPLVGSEALEGAPTAAPPADTGGYTSKKEIMAIQDRQKRRTAIAANLDLF